MAHKTEAQWQAEGDANSVAEAAAIQSDPKRLAAAKVAAKRIAAEENKRAGQLVSRAKALSKLAKTKPATAKPKPKPATAKPKPKPATAKPKPKPAAKKPAAKAKPKARPAASRKRR